MISDVLADAICEIERCQRKFPETYDDIADRIEETKWAMDRLRAMLDAVPNPPEWSEEIWSNGGIDCCVFFLANTTPEARADGTAICPSCGAKEPCHTREKPWWKQRSTEEL